MKGIWIAPEQLFDGKRVLVNKSVRIESGRVAEVADPPIGAHRVEGCLTPGFVDLQVNGGGGVMLNSTPTRSGMAEIAGAHRQFGTVAILPTVITDRPDVLDHAAEAAIAAKDDAGIIGLHIEGPHISQARRGTHKAAYIRPMDTRTMEVVARLRQHDVCVMITVAPEAISLDQIAALSRMGAVVSLGHTDATAEAVAAALSAGAGCATHLFNAMSPMTSRAPGAVGAVLNSTTFAGIICDGHHVDDRMVQLALRARPQDDLMFAVSDAVATVGGSDHFELYGAQIRLEGGRLINSEGSLAGAHTTLAESVARLVQNVGAPLEQALRMAVTTPARLMGHPQLAQLSGRSVHDIMLLSGTQTVTGTLAALIAEGANEIGNAK